MNEEKIPLKYKWRPTGLGQPDDFCGFDPAHLDKHGNPVCIGRFYLGHIAGGKAWRWFCQWQPAHGGPILPSGMATSAREAAKAIEDGYDATRASVRL